MDLATEKNDLPIITDHIRLPNRIWSGRYDRFGNRDDKHGNVFITTKGTAFVWCVFGCELLAGQRGDMIIANAPGSFLVGVSLSAWHPADGKGKDKCHDEPSLGEGLFTLISSQRSRDAVRIVGRNHSNVSSPAAVGLVLADDAPYNPPGS